MPTSELVKTKESKGVFHIILNRPEKLNVFIEPMREELSSIFDSLHERDDLRVCVLTGAGRGFCAGGDIKVMEEIIAKNDFERIQTFLKWGKKIVSAIRGLNIPVIAAINGPAAGAGMNLALACDYRIASNKATFGQTFINIGLLPDWGGSYFLPRLVSTSRALEMCWTGRIIEAHEAQTLGLIDRLVPEADLEGTVNDFCADIIAKPKKVVGLVKKGIYEGQRSNLNSMLAYEEAAQDECIRTGEAEKGMQRFLEERASRRKKT